MPTRLYKPTISLRTTVDQQARIILPAEENLPPELGNHYRDVTVIIPNSPEVFLGIDIPVQKKFSQKGIGPNRTFGMPRVENGQCICFPLLDGQWITAMAGEQDAKITVICAYIEDT